MVVRAKINSQGPSTVAAPPRSTKQKWNRRSSSRLITIKTRQTGEFCFGKFEEKLKRYQKYGKKLWITFVINDDCVA